MSVLRLNKDSIIAVLEAFLYDPVINWIKTKNELNDTNKENEDKVKSPKSPAELAAAAAAATGQTQLGKADADAVKKHLEREFDEKPNSAPALQEGNLLSPFVGKAGINSKTADVVEDEVKEKELNDKASEMIARVIQKLAGRDFNLDDDSFDELSVKEQVEKLIVEATSLEHLCIMYHGWKPYC